MKCVNIKFWDILGCFHYILNAPRTLNTKKWPKTDGKLRTQSNHQVLQYGAFIDTETITMYKKLRCERHIYIFYGILN